MRYYAYVRVSRKNAREGEGFIAPDVQKDKIDAWARSHGHEIVQTYEEFGSGAKLDRPEFLAMLTALEGGGAGGVVVARLDRLGRTLIGSLEAIDRIRAADADLASVADALDTSTDTGKLVLNIMLSIAEFELNRIRGSWNDANVRAIERGVHIAPGVPFGYAKDENSRLAPNGDAGTLRELFDRKASGESNTSLARWLNDVAPQPGKTWTRNTVRELVSRRVYLGVAHWGQHENRNAHPRLVDETTWQRAQGTARTWTRARGDDVALLNGLVRCQGCRRLMSRRWNAGKRAYYRCSGGGASGVCVAPAAVRADGEHGLEAYVERIVVDGLRDFGGALMGVPTNDDLEEAIADRDEAERELAEIQNDTTAKAALGNDWLGFVMPYVERAKTARGRVEALSVDATPVEEATHTSYLDADREGRAAIMRDLIHGVVVVQASPEEVKRSQNKAAKPAELGTDRVLVIWKGDGPGWPAANQIEAPQPFPWALPDS
jgi:DNA invertase Pin-like site-specific DNA recombinase